MNYNLFIDDQRIPKQVTWIELPLVEWTIVKNYKEFTNIILKNGLPTRISFDHDLGDEHYKQQDEIDYSSFSEKTGYDCAKWLIGYCLNNRIKMPEIYVHSLNIVGSENIRKLISAFKKYER